MAVVTHHIGKNFYAYEHYRDGKTVRSKYIGPVDSKGAIRAPHIGKGVDRQPVGTTYQSLRRIYMKSVRRKEMEDAEDERRKIESKKRIVTAKRSK